MKQKRSNQLKIIKFRFGKGHIPLLILFVFGTLMLFMGIMNHYCFRTDMYHFGTYIFAFWDYSHLRISPVPGFPGNFLQDHFSFLLMYFIPLFWLLNWLTGTYTLIIIQNVLIIIAAWYSYKIIRLKTENIWIGTGILLYYFLLHGRYSTFGGDVNLAIMSACFIPVFLYYFEIKKYLPAFIIFVLSLFSRENIPIWFIFIFIVLIIRHRKDRRAVIYSIGGIAVSVVYFILLFKVFIPAIEIEDRPYSLFNYAALGETPFEAIQFVLQHPLETIKLFFVNHLDNPAYDGVKAEFYFVYLVSGGVILLLRPQYLIWLIPVVAQKVLNDQVFRWGITTYYAIEFITLLPLSVFLTISSIKSVRIQTALAIAVCSFTIPMTIYKLDPRNIRLPEFYNPAKENFYSREFYRSPYNLGETHRLLKIIPEKAEVSASAALCSHLAARSGLHVFPEVGDAEYIVFSVFDNLYLYPHMENEYSRQACFDDPDLKIVGQEFPVFLFKRKDPGDDRQTPLEHIKQTFDTLYCDFENIDTVNRRVLFHNGDIALPSEKVRSDPSDTTNHLYWMDEGYTRTIDLNKIKEPSRISISLSYRGEGDNLIIIAKNGFANYHTSAWQKNEAVPGWKKIEMIFWCKPYDKDRVTIFLANKNPEDPILLDDMVITRISLHE